MEEALLLNPEDKTAEKHHSVTKGRTYQGTPHGLIEAEANNSSPNPRLQCRPK